MRAALALVAALTPAVALAQVPDDYIGDRVHASALAAQSFQGPLDGAWTLVSGTGEALYAFQLVDKPDGDSLEGVWRDLRHPSVPGDIGLIDSLIRTPGELTVRFAPKPGAAAVTIDLKTDPAGVWSGDLREAGAVTPVKMRRG